jgi:uncharacterized membrane protein (UPF0127 family)
MVIVALTCEAQRVEESPAAWPLPSPVVTARVSPTSTPASVTTVSSTRSATPVPVPSATPFPPTAVPIESPSTVVAPQFVDNPDCSSVSRVQLPLADVIITYGARSVSVVAEMARSSTEQLQGLMCRAAVPDGTGMLFLWDAERTGGFWMFNTYGPLDIIYFGGGDGDVLIKQMTPCPRDGSEDDTTWRSRCRSEASEYLSGISYTTTLELPLGWLEVQGFDTSDPEAIGVSLVARD